MHGNNIQGYKWSDKPILISFVSINSYSSSSKINDTVNHCCEMIDFFDFFLNPSMVNLIVKYSNLKLRNKTLAKSKSGKKNIIFKLKASLLLVSCYHTVF